MVLASPADVGGPSSASCQNLQEADDTRQETTRTDDFDEITKAEVKFYWFYPCSISIHYASLYDREGWGKEICICIIGMHGHTFIKAFK